LGSPLTISERGRGHAVVLIHGALGDYRQWDPIGERLESAYRVLAVSRRYHWPNPPPAPDAPYSYESHGDDLIQWLRSLGTRVHLVGHSYGAGVALMAVLGEPKHVRSLTLIEPAFGSVVPSTAAGFDAEAASRIAMVDAVHRFVEGGSDERAAEALMDWVQGGAGGFSRLSAETRAGLLENAATMGPTFAVVARNITCDQLRTVRTPTLVMTGERTRVWYRLIAEAVSSCIPGSEMGEIQSAGHMAIVENPEDTASGLLRFLGKQ
jgi:pimeloyl-ACP methyl ester carboxylesterase